MNKLISLSLLAVIIFFHSFCNSRERITSARIELSAFGVESDNFPSIDVFIDFINDSSVCKKSYYDPSIKSSTYKLSKAEIKKVLELLQDANLALLKTEYRVEKTDQPTTTTTILKGKTKYIIKDYGLNGDYPLQEIYDIVFKY